MDDGDRLVKCVCVVSVLCGWLVWTTKKRLVVEEFNFRLAMFELICVWGGTTVVTIVTVVTRVTIVTMITQLQL